MADKSIKLMITSAIAIDGKIQRAGQIVTVSESVAKNLLSRGRAELAELDEDTANAQDAPTGEPDPGTN